MSKLDKIFNDVFIQTLELRLDEDIPTAKQLIKDLIHQIGENVIGEQAIDAAVKSGLGVSEWEAFLMPEEREMLTKFRKQVESL